MSTADPRKRRPGLTVIEVVFVVGIIVLLVIVLFPLFGRDKRLERPYSTQCLSNLHQVGLGLAGYAAENKTCLPPPSKPGEIAWFGLCASLFIGRASDTSAGDVIKMNIFHCPKRESTRSDPFIDYVYNTLDPNGLDSNGQWLESADHRAFRLGVYRQPSAVVAMCDAENEADVEDFREVPSVKTAHDQWKTGPGGWRNPGLHAMTVWKGGHLPQGKNGINTTDQTGPRRAARTMHLSRRINGVFLDAHAGPLELSSQPTEAENYAYWLRLFGVEEPLKIAREDDDLF